MNKTNRSLNGGAKLSFSSFFFYFNSNGDIYRTLYNYFGGATKCSKVNKLKRKE